MVALGWTTTTAEIAKWLQDTDDAVVGTLLTAIQLHQAGDETLSHWNIGGRWIDIETDENAGVTVIRPGTEGEY